MPARRFRTLVLSSCLVLSLSWSPDAGLAPDLLAAPAVETLTVMSLNLAMQNDVDRLVAGIRAAGGDAADILVLQEVLQTKDEPSVADRIATELGLEAVFRPSFKISNDRSVGLATLSRFPVTAPGGALVAGDFNTNENLWLLHTIPLPFLGRQGSSLEHYMARHGLRSAFDGGATHDALRMRLDWMFLKDMRATARAIHPTNVSDHHALLVSLRPAHQP